MRHFEVMVSSNAEDIDDAMRRLALYFLLRVLDPDATESYGVIQCDIFPREKAL